jgi:hypothetical protein
VREQKQQPRQRQRITSDFRPPTATGKPALNVICWVVKQEMAAMICKRCGSVFLGISDRCPHCGRRNPGPTGERVARVIASAVGVLALALVIFLWVRFSEQPRMPLPKLDNTTEDWKSDRKLPPPTGPMFQ